MMKAAIFVLLVCASLLSGACSADLFSPSSEVYRGHYNFGFEVSAFLPCNAKEPWWVTGELTAVNKFIVEHAEPTAPDGGPPRWGTLYVEWRGEPSRRGEYGHMSSYSREFDVVEILEVRAATSNDCR